MIDDKRKPRYDMVAYPNFTPDIAHYVYVAVRGEKTFTVVDDRESAQAYDEIWSTPGRRFIFDSRKQFHYLAIKDDQTYLVGGRGGVGRVSV